MTKEVKESIDWTQSDENQATWPRKSKVSLCLLQSTGIMMMIEGLNMVKKGLGRQGLQKVNGETVRAKLELSSQQNPLGKAPAMFYKALHHAKGDKTKIHPSWGRSKFPPFARTGSQTRDRGRGTRARGLEDLS